MKRAQLIKTIESSLKRLNNRFASFAWKSWGIYCAVLFIAGALINIVTDYRFNNFWLHQILLIIATTMLVGAMRSYFRDIHMFTTGSDQNLLVKVPEVGGLFTNRFMPLQSSIWSVLAAIIITVFFFSCIVLLEYIEADIIGLYAIYIAGTSVLIGVYAYMQYIYFLWFIYQAEKCSFDHYSYNMRAPAESAWISQLAKTSQRLRNQFLFIGLIYVIEYSILIPTDKISFDSGGISLSTPNNAAFVISWAALFLLVILAFPVLNHVQHRLVVRLVKKLKSQTISELSELMFEEQRFSANKKEQMFTVVSYSTLIEDVRNSKDYPIKRQFSYEALMTIVTFAVHIMNLWSKLNSIPQIALLLP